MCNNLTSKDVNPLQIRGDRRGQFVADVNKIRLVPFGTLFLIGLEYGFPLFVCPIIVCLVFLKCKVKPSTSADKITTCKMSNGSLITVLNKFRPSMFEKLLSTHRLRLFQQIRFRKFKQKWV